MELPMRRPFHHRDFRRPISPPARAPPRSRSAFRPRTRRRRSAPSSRPSDSPRKQHPLVDEIVVVDDRSTDETGACHGGRATVVSTGAPLADVVPGTGKGEALWRGLAASSGDLVVFCDADVTDFDARFVVGLAGTVVRRPDDPVRQGLLRAPRHARTGHRRAHDGTGGPTTAVAPVPFAHRHRAAAVR